jgi:signal transduction histidine kinase
MYFYFGKCGWPALLLDGSGVILRANPAAVKTFGPVLEGEAPLLSAIWSAENGLTPEQFSRSGSIRRRARRRSNFSSRAAASGRVFNASDLLLQQWTGKQFCLPGGAGGRRGGGRKKPRRRPSALKQKLDCALQLARTVSLDFNNALTSVLGHTSLLLGKAEPGHPWRHSLMEVEKSAERAAEIANELAAFSRQEMDAPARRRAI